MQVFSVELVGGLLTDNQLSGIQKYVGDNKAWLKPTIIAVTIAFDVVQGGRGLYHIGRLVNKARKAEAAAARHLQDLRSVTAERLGAARIAGFKSYSLNEYAKAIDDRQMFNRRRLLKRGKGDYESYRLPGKAFDVESHVQDGAIRLFGEPLEGKLIWTVDVNGNFNMGLGDAMLGGGGRLNPLGRVSHAILAGGNDILGGGEVMLKGGKIWRNNGLSGIEKGWNSHTGHYAPWHPSTYTPAELRAFNYQSDSVFRAFARKVGLRFF